MRLGRPRGGSNSSCPGLSQSLVRRSSRSRPWPHPVPWNEAGHLHTAECLARTWVRWSFSSVAFLGTRRAGPVPLGAYLGRVGHNRSPNAPGVNSGSAFAPLPKAVGHRPDTAMIRVVLLVHPRTPAQVDGEVKLDVEGPATQARSSTHSKPAIRCCAGRSATGSRNGADRC
jgi:hypothetical protein